MGNLKPKLLLRRSRKSFFSKKKVTGFLIIHGRAVFYLLRMIFQERNYVLSSFLTEKIEGEPELVRFQNF